MKWFLPLFFTIVFLTPAIGFASEETRQEVDQANCLLNDCWGDVFPAIRRVVHAGAAAIRRYREEFEHKMDRADLLDDNEPNREELLLQYRLTILRQYLEECEILRDGPRQPRHIIIIGHHFEADGQNQRLAGLTVYNDIVLRECGVEAQTSSYRRCRRSVVLFEDTNKRDLMNFLALLGPRSLRSLTYTGHGISNALVLGPKNLLLPVNWSPDLRISATQWRNTNIGMLYSRDLDEYSAQLRRVIRRGAPVSLYACDTGAGFAGSLGRVLRTSPVEGCLVPMHYEYLNDAGVWITDWDNPVPADAQRTRLVPDLDGMFQRINPAAQSAQEVTGSTAAPVGTPNDRATRDIVLRLSINASNEATVNDGQRLIVFSIEEQAVLRQIMNGIVHDRSIDPQFSAQRLNELFQQRITTASAGEQAVLRRLHQKIQDCVQEAVRLYY